MSRIAITGAAGRLGQALCRRLAADHDVIPLDHYQLDLSRPISPQLPADRCDWIINSGAITSVDFCEDASELAFRVNGESVGELAAAARKNNGRLIQISTDYVFDGEEDIPRKEDDTPNPKTVYGKSKLMGERLALESDPSNMVIRISWVFGPDRPAFPEFILNRALETDYVEAVSDKHSSPSYTPDIADWIAALIGNPDAGGIYHLSNQGGCSWQEYGQEVLNVAREMGLPLKSHTVHPILMNDLPAFKVTRPVFTEMANTRFTGLTGIKPRPWQDAVREHILALGHGDRGKRRTPMRNDKTRWRGLRDEAAQALAKADYKRRDLAGQLDCGGGVDARRLLDARDEITTAGGWIPGFELYARSVHPQRFRGLFSELGRSGEGRLGEIGLWPRQWAAATMFAGTAKGFHIHPPFIPDNFTPADWLQHLFGASPAPVSERPYDCEQWDVMHILHGRLRMVLIDERAGMPRRRMEFYIVGDNLCQDSNIGVVIPPGIAHALQAEGGTDVLMVYGTSTIFDPAAEGRIAAEIERPAYPTGWEAYIEG